MSENTSVVQEWVSKLPWKMQSILFSGLRGPDQEFLYHTKQVSKWLRSVSQNNADPSKPYMNGIKLPQTDEEMAEFFKELEHCTCHFVHHFLDALAVVAYGHPDEEVSRRAYGYHYEVAEELFHFIPESASVFFLRHRDKRDGVDDQRDTWFNHVSGVLTGLLDVLKFQRGKLGL